MKIASLFLHTLTATVIGTIAASAQTLPLNYNIQLQVRAATGGAALTCRTARPSTARARA
jgi:hypothetical protein